ncbi:MAG: hypothetical protein JXB29_02640 [Sedimentisphaerales bacterium]|nr:hypothetical protein [Sedimentisphaerales bacterium]
MKEKIKKAIDEMVNLLEIISGAAAYQLRTAAYYASLTWHLQEFDRFPYLVYYGNSGVGKSELITATSYFCYNLVHINASTETAKVIREKFDASNGGTAVMEEFGDSPLGEEVYSYLNGRYARATATAGKMTPTQSGGWKQKEYKTFGATLIHRLEHFRQPTLQNRSIWLYILFNPGAYAKAADIKGMAQDIAKVLRETMSTQIPTSYETPKFAPRIVDTYEPILRLANFLNDSEYLKEVHKEMQIADSAFKDGQTYQPKGLLLRGLIALLTIADPNGGEKLDISKSIKIADILEVIRRNYQQGLTTRQANQYLEEMHFTVRQSGGYPKVMALTVPQLTKACLEQGIRDELVVKLAGNNP